MPDIEHVFFDIGGVLGTNGWGTGERRRAVEKFKLDPADFQWRHEGAAGPWEEGRISIDEYLDITVFHCPRDFTREDFRKFMYSVSIPDKASIAVARDVASLGRYTMMTLNNESAELNSYRIQLFEIGPIFEAFFSSCWLGSRKPMKKIYADALAIAQATPSKSLFIDDREPNLAPAQELGMNTIHFENAVKLREQLRATLGADLPGA